MPMLMLNSIILRATRTQTTTLLVSSLSTPLTRSSTSSSTTLTAFGAATAFSSTRSRGKFEVRSLSSSGIRAFHHNPTVRNMSGKKEWLVVIPDHPGALEKRLKVRSQHFANLKANPALTFGGATLDSQPDPAAADGGKLEFNGSAITLEAESKEELLEILRADIYATSGVWDVDNAKVYPFKTGVRSAP